MQIQWKPGYHARVEAKVAHEAVEKIRRKHGGDVEPEHVVEAAKAKSNPLHKQLYYLDDTAAAREWRLEEARLMLRSLVRIESESPKVQPQRVYEVKRVSATETTPARNVYSRMEDIMADPEARAELLGRALKELLAFRQRYKQLQELAIVMRAVDETLETIEA